MFSVAKRESGASFYVLKARTELCVWAKVPKSSSCAFIYDWALITWSISLKVRYIQFLTLATVLEHQALSLWDKNQWITKSKDQVHTEMGSRKTWPTHFGLPHWPTLLAHLRYSRQTAKSKVPEGCCQKTDKTWN